MIAIDVFEFIPTWLLQTLHWVAGVVVVIEALNKLERTAFFDRGQSLKHFLAVVLKAIAWVLLAIGGMGAIVTPLMLLSPPTLQDVSVLAGFAILIIRTRVKEG